MGSDNDYDVSKMRGSVHVVAGSHLITLHFEGLAELVGLMKLIEKRGYKPYFEARKNFAADIVMGSLYQQAGGPEEAPKCKRHHVPMTTSAKKGCKWYCKKKDGDRYCDHWIDDHGAYHDSRT